MILNTLSPLLLISIIFIISIDNSFGSLNYPWMYYLQYGNDVTLKPLFRNESEVIQIKTCKWIMPNGIEIIPDTYNPNPNRFSLVKYNCELTIKNIQEDTNGVYHCNINDEYISKALLNIHGAPKATMLEEFTPNLIAGFVTFFSIILLFGFSCGIAKFRYRTPEEKKKRTIVEGTSQDNPSFVDERGIELEITKQTRF